MEYFNIGKEEVLNQIYIRELPLIIQRISKKKLQVQKDKLGDYLVMLNIATATAGMIPSIEGIQKLNKTINQQLGKLEQEPKKKVNQFDEVGFNKLKAILESQGGEN